MRSVTAVTNLQTFYLKTVYPVFYIYMIGWMFRLSFSEREKRFLKVFLKIVYKIACVYTCEVSLNYMQIQKKISGKDALTFVEDCRHGNLSLRCLHRWISCFVLAPSRPGFSKVQLWGFFRYTILAANIQHHFFISLQLLQAWEY